jgi:hypothetical protein
MCICAVTLHRDIIYLTQECIYGFLIMTYSLSKPVRHVGNEIYAMHLISNVKY